MRHGQGDLRRLLQRAARHLFDPPAVGHDFDLLLDGIGDAGAAGGDLQSVIADFRDANPVRRGLHLIRRQLDALGRLVEQFEPLAVVQRQLHGLRLGEIVIDDHRHRHLVAARQRHRQVQIDEERLKDADARLVRPELAVRRDRAGRQPPGRDRVGQVDVEAGMALVVGEDFGLPEERFGEPFADANS